MPDDRTACNECGGEALQGTLDRNDGLCQACANRIRNAEQDRASSRFALRIFGLTGGLAVLATAILAWLCIRAGWGTGWALVFALFMSPLIFHLIEFTGSVIYALLSVGRRAPGPDGKPTGEQGVAASD